MKVVVSNIFYFHSYLGKWSNLTNTFQRGWNNQLEHIGGMLFVCLPTKKISCLSSWPARRFFWTKAWIPCYQFIKSSYVLLWEIQVWFETNSHLIEVIKSYGSSSPSKLVRYARLLWEFWKRDSELFPPEVVFGSGVVLTEMFFFCLKAPFGFV